MAPRGRPKKDQVGVSKLLAALNFCSLANRDDGLPYQEHVILTDKQAISFDGIVACGHPINEEIFTCPHTDKLKEALKRAGDKLSITKLDSGRLSVKGGAFRAFVPCLPIDQMQRIMPDENVYAVKDDLRKAICNVGMFAELEADQSCKTCVEVDGPIATATDGKIIIQAYHGYSMPPKVHIPKQAIKALEKAPGEVVGIGYAPDRSITFHFDSGAWLRTQLLAGVASPSWDSILKMESGNETAMPEEMAAGLDAISLFSDDNFVTFLNEQLATSRAVDAGAQYDMAGVPDGPAFSISLLKKILPFAKTIDWHASHGAASFFGDKYRGIIGKVIS